MKESPGSNKMKVGCSSEVKKRKESHLRHPRLAKSRGEITTWSNPRTVHLRRDHTSSPFVYFPGPYSEITTATGERAVKEAAVKADEIYIADNGGLG